jgi:hypothetical protein
MAPLSGRGGIEVTEDIIFEPNCKFAILAIHDVRADVPAGLVLQDGTKVLDNFPFKLDDDWKRWLGSVQVGQLDSKENLFFVRTATGGSGTVDEELQSQLHGVVVMLRSLGAFMHENMFMLDGHVVNGKPDCHHFEPIVPFCITLGCRPLVVREAELRTAIELRKAYAKLQKQHLDPDRWRFGRGYYSLKVALEQYHVSDRLHGFVRALEALILPEQRNTTNQFASRCALFAGPKSNETVIKEVLQEAYKMRCDVEHMHDWDRSLGKYPVAEREDISLLRTRQMEELASAAYRQILSDKTLESNFCDDATLKGFWGRPEDEIRAAFGNVCDISQLKIVKRDPDGWADPTEWTPEQIENFWRRSKAA